MSWNPWQNGGAEYGPYREELRHGFERRLAVLENRTWLGLSVAILAFFVGLIGWLS